MPVSHHLPWQVNLAAKIVLSRMPVSYHVWKRVGFFNLGAMDDPKYAFSVFYRHFKAAGFSREREREREAIHLLGTRSQRLVSVCSYCYFFRRDPNLSRGCGTVRDIRIRTVSQAGCLSPRARFDD